MIRNAAEETDRGVADILPSWGAAMLRPYMIVPRRENGMHCGDLARRRRRRDLPWGVVKSSHGYTPPMFFARVGKMLRSRGLTWCPKMGMSKCFRLSYLRRHSWDTVVRLISRS